MAWDPSLTLEIGFGSTYQTNPVTWTDLTAYTLPDGFRVNRKRQRQLDTIEAGTLSFSLKNTDGRFNPWNTAGAYSPNIKIGMPVRLSAVYNSTTYRLFYGFVESWVPDPDIELNSVSVTCHDAFGLFQPWNLTTTRVSELSSARVAAILDAISWPAGLRSLDTGLTTMLADSPAEESVLSLLQAAVDAEFGVLYHAPNGNITFHNRHHRSTAPYNVVQATFGGASGLAHGPVKLPFDNVNLYNYVSCTREGGSAQVAQDSTSQAAHGKRSLTRSALQMDTDAEALSQAGWILYRSKDPETEVDSITLIGRNDTSLGAQMLGRDVGDRVQIVRVQTGDDFDEIVIIESVSHTMKQKGSEWETVWRCSPARFWGFWIVESSQVEVDTVVGY